MDFLALLEKIGFEKPELVGETGFNSSPKTKGVLFRAGKSKIHKQETTNNIKHGVEKAPKTLGKRTKPSIISGR
jgi:hypothetical protein